MAELHTLRPHQKRKKKKIIGRGNASGLGTYSGRGIKGQRARSGGTSGLKRRGLKQYLLQIPKVRGFKKPDLVSGVNVGTLSEVFSEGQHVTPKLLLEKGLIRKGRKVKLLGGGTLSKKISVSAHAASKSAREAIEKAGGTFRKIQRS